MSTSMNRCFRTEWNPSKRQCRPSIGPLCTREASRALRRHPGHFHIVIELAHTASSESFFRNSRALDPRHRSLHFQKGWYRDLMMEEVVVRSCRGSLSSHGMEEVHRKASRRREVDQEAGRSRLSLGVGLWAEHIDPYRKGARVLCSMGDVRMVD